MKVKSEFWQESLRLRPLLIREFLMYHGPSDAEAANTLCHLAYSWSYRSTDRVIKGATLRAWIDSGSEPSIPRWAALTAARYILSRGFKGREDSALRACFVHLMDVATDESSLLQDFNA